MNTTILIIVLLLACGLLGLTYKMLFKKTHYDPAVIHPASL